MLSAATPSSFPPVLRKFPPALLSLVFPDNCRICSINLVHLSRIPVCPACLAKPVPMQAEYFCRCCGAAFLSPYPLDENGQCGLCRRGVTGFDAAYSFGAYEDELRSLIHVFKYGKVQTLAGPLGKLLRQALPRDQRFDLIVPMPMHWRKRWQRGFNQASLLAGEVSRFTGVPTQSPVSRVHQRTAQAGLTNAKRRANVVGAFRVSNPGRVSGKRILLIDDVMTTGASASACANALKRAGAQYIALLTVARVDRRLNAASTSGIDPLFPESTVSGSYEDAKSGSLT